MKHRKKLIVGLILIIAIAAPTLKYRRWIYSYFARLPLFARTLPASTGEVLYRVEDQLATYGNAARARLKAKFDSKTLTYPPQRMALFALKSTAEMQVYVAPPAGPYQYLCSYPILAASGELGPKLREGDRQVPEGMYELTLEPNTPYHLALRLNYPNPDDWQRAKDDGRESPGSDILIHGNSCSIGCLAMGDEASEDLFVLAADACDQKLPLIIAPHDFRSLPLPENKETDPLWLPALYRQIKSALNHYPAPLAAANNQQQH